MFSSLEFLSGVARKISRGGKTFQEGGGAKISKSKIFRPKKLFHESMKLVIPLHSL